MIKQLLAALICLIAATSASAQCTPNVAYADSSAGIWPDTLENIPCAFADNPDGYEAIIDVKTAADTNVTIEVSGFPVSLVGYIEAFRINGVEGLPEGFTYIPNSSIWANGGTEPPFTPVQGCVSIIAGQSTLASYINDNPGGIDFPLTVIVDVKIHSTNNAFANNLLTDKWLSDPSLEAIPGIGPIPVSGYVIKVRPSNDGNGCQPLSISKISSNQFEVEGNFPNPFSTSTEIRYSSRTSKAMRFEVRNMVGKLVVEQTLQANSGLNTITLKSEKLIPGIYFYSLSDGNQTITKRMVVSGN